ncbi:MAG: mechanosensitive ion channel family protein [Gemmatimonadota bacterium]|nr:mechanosensitive ion channel family protein [Gemmatimonadota bacterium]MDH4349728.1 mechanosensitive ion channel family protein [Gemmatimonadota bacterium]MDH5196337.1 mechanosensitive ion channel family protein [Gemmatimonadota bacterium]
MILVQQWLSSLQEASRNLVGLLPALAGASALVLAGWLLGRLLAYWGRRGTGGVLDRLARRPSLRGAITTSGAASQVPRVIGAFVFWVVFLFFAAAALETVGLPVVTASLNRVAYYLPNVLAALVVVFAGIIGGNLAHGGVTRAAAGTGVAFGPAIGTTVQGTIVLVAVVVALEQIGIKAQLLIVIVGVVTGTTLAGAALAFGLGARTAVSNVIASYYVAQAYQVGQQVRVAGVEGKIVQTTPTAVFVSTPQGRVMVPARHFSEDVTVLVTDG